MENTTEKALAFFHNKMKELDFIEMLVAYAAPFVAEVDKIKAERAWVDVKERLPKRDTTVIINNNEGVYIAHYDDYYEGEPEWTDPNEGQEVKVTHWMYLPAPPQNEVE